MIRMGDCNSAYAAITLRSAMMIEIFCGDYILADGSGAPDAGVEGGGDGR